MELLWVLCYYLCSFKIVVEGVRSEENHVRRRRGGRNGWDGTQFEGVESGSDDEATRIQWIEMHAYLYCSLFHLILFYWRLIN